MSAQLMDILNVDMFLVAHLSVHFNLKQGFGLLTMGGSTRVGDARDHQERSAHAHFNGYLQPSFTYLYIRKFTLDFVPVKLGGPPV